MAECDFCEMKLRFLTVENKNHLQNLQFTLENDNPQGFDIKSGDFEKNKTTLKRWTAL